MGRWITMVAVAALAASGSVKAEDVALGRIEGGTVAFAMNHGKPGDFTDQIDFTVTTQSVVSAAFVVDAAGANDVSLSFWALKEGPLRYLYLDPIATTGVGPQTIFPELVLPPGHYTFIVSGAVIGRRGGVGGTLTVSPVGVVGP